MAITTTSNFDAQKESEGHYPIFLVELLGLGRFYATKEPGFSGLWLAGQGLTAMTVNDTSRQILAGDSQPTYETLLHKLGNNGISSISFQLSPEDFARTGDTAVSLINEGFIHLELEDELLENTVARIMLGWNGLARIDYIPVFKGVIDSTGATLERFDLRFADDTVRNIVPVPAQIGSDFRPRAFDQGKAFPIVLGDVEDVPMIQLVGDASTVLGQALTTSDVVLYYFNPTTPFPRSGTVRITDSAVNYTVTYDGVTTETIGNQVYGKLSLTSAPSSNAATGATVALEDHLKKYLVSFAGQNIRRIRTTAGAAPAGAPTWKNEAIDPTGNDHRRITVVEQPHATADGQSLQATIASEARGENKVFNGNFLSNVTGWTVSAGSFDHFTPGGTFDPVGRIRTNAAQVIQSITYQDVTVDANVRHRLTFTARNNDLVFMAVNIGTPTDATKYYQFGDISDTSEQLFDLIFEPDESTVRITLVGDNGASGSAQEGYFDQFDLYDVTTENPATQIEHLIDTHMPQIDPDPVSFQEAFNEWDASQDRIAGVLQQTEEQQALLGRIAQQFRARTFLGEDGLQKLRVFNQSRPPERSLTLRDIVKGSMRVSRSPLKEIFTHYYVYYGRVPEIPTPGENLGGRVAFSGAAVATPSETSHPTIALNTLCKGAREQFRKESTLEVFADLVPDAQTACNTLEYLVRKGTHQRTRVEFQSWFRMVDIEVTDFVKIAHPLLDGNRIYEVKEKEVIPNGGTTRWVCEEIAPFKFGSFTEHWEPPTTKLKALILTEHWEPPQPGEATIPSESNPLPSYTESWEPYTQVEIFDFQQWDSADALTEALYGAVSTMPEGYASYGGQDNLSGIPMFPNIIYSAANGGESVTAKTPVHSRVHSIGSALPPLVTKDGFATNSSWIELRPSFGADKGEFCKILATHTITPGTSNTVNVENLDFDTVMPSGLVNIEKPFSLRVWVNMDTKSYSQPIWQGYDQNVTGGTPFTRVPYAIYYNSAQDRFEFAVGVDITGLGNTLEQNVTEITNSGARVRATTFGSPSTGTWYQLLCTWDPSTSTATIKVNNGTVDSLVITPDFTTSLSRAGLIGAWSFTYSGVALDSAGAPNYGVGADRATFDGKMAHWAYWGRTLSSSEGDTLYGAGTPYRFDNIT